jgi:phage-related minor tail protein
MTYEEMQRMMEFILEQQAQLVANGQRTDERINRADERVNRLIDIVDRLATVTVGRFEGADARVSALSEEVDAKFAALIDAQIRTEETLSAKINALVESQARTEETLNTKISALVEAQRLTSESVRKTDEAVRNLTDVVGRHLREHGNGERDVSRE